MKHFTRSFLIIMMLVGLCSAVPVSKGGSFALPNQTAYTPLLSFFEKCCDGEWTSGSPRTKPEVLPCPGSDADDRGFVRPLGVNFVLENDNPGTRSIQTHPKWVTSGYIQGVFPLADFGIKLQSGDRFSSKVGFLKGAGQGEVKFTVLYDSKPNQSGGEVKLAEIVHPYTGKLEPSK